MKQAVETWHGAECTHHASCRLPGALLVSWLLLLVARGEMLLGRFPNHTAWLSECGPPITSLLSHGLPPNTPPHTHTALLLPSHAEVMGDDELDEEAEALR